MKYTGPSKTIAIFGELYFENGKLLKIIFIYSDFLKSETNFKNLLIMSCIMPIKPVW
jgi:hypothetical protein